MTRKINTTRLNGLITTIVFAVSLGTLALGGYSAYVFPAKEEVLLQEFEYCKKEFFNRAYTDCTIYTQSITNIHKMILIYLNIGLGLPIVFFIVKALMNYLAPEEKVT